MGGLVIEKVREGVEFVPDAAAAFRRAEAQVQRERGRNIDVNSTWRDWDEQLRMYNNWQAYISGRGPYPGHSKALHPADPLAFHTKGTAVDSDDWRDARIVQILAENGFIRNRLYVPNEEHHFEYIRARDRNYGKPLEDKMNAEQSAMLEAVYAGLFGARNLTGKKDQVSWVNKGGDVQRANYGVLPIVIHSQTLIAKQAGQIAAINEVVEQLAAANGAALNMSAIEKAAQRGAQAALDGWVSS